MWILFFALGWLLGALMTAYTLLRPAPMKIVEDADVAIPVVRIFGIEDGALRGAVEGEMRIVAGEEPVFTDGSGNFLIRDRSILTNHVTVQVPPGMQYVASKRGKKYYPVGSAESFSIIPENRVYFQSASEAETAGFTR